MTGMHSTGTRIREHRMLKGQKQADLAREIGISPTYLNLIEHNKRNIGGKLLSKIAARLDLDVAALTGGADADVVAGLLEAASANPALRAERDRVEDLTTRFPGWSAVIGAQQTRVADLERMVETLGDRVAHDPDLAAALHDVLTTATAIGAAASILTETKEIEPEWRDRFHRNIHEDSQRLAQSSQALVKFLEGSGVSDPVLRAPEEELDAWLAATDHHIAGLERSLPLTDELLFQSGPGLTSADAQALARPVFARYRAEAQSVPMGELQNAVAQLGLDPVALARRFATSLPVIFRRLASLPPDPSRARIGVAMCDSSGTLTYRKPLAGFSMPRYGGGCPTWPLYQALARPMMPLRALVETNGPEPTRYLTFAYAEPIGRAAFDTAPVYEATMLIVPSDWTAFPEVEPQQVGTNCRVFPCDFCARRRGG